MDPEKEEDQSTCLGQVTQEFKCQIDGQVRDENDINEEYTEKTSTFMLTKVYKCQVDEVVENAFNKLKIDFCYLASKTGTIEFKKVMRMLEDIWKTIDYDLEPLYKVPCQSIISGNNEKEAKVVEIIEKMQISQYRLSHVLETALDEAQDGLSVNLVLYGQTKTAVTSIDIDTVLRQLEITQKSIFDQLNSAHIDTLPDLVLLRIFCYLSLSEKICFRRVCPRFQTLLDEKCRSITSLKLFDCYKDRFSYISKVHACQLSQPADDHLHLHHDGRADDLTILRPKAESIQQIANRFQAIKTLVFVSLADTSVLSFLSVFTNLTTLVISNDISHNHFSWTSLTSFTSLRRLYLFQIYSDNEEDNLEAAAIVLGRLTCLVTLYLSTELVPMLSVEMKQFNCFNLSKPSWIELCSRLSALTYLHIPYISRTTALELFHPLMSLPNLVELSLNLLSVLPSISEIHNHSLELRTVKKVLIYNNMSIFEIEDDAFTKFCEKFEQTDIKVEHSLELLEKMTGPHWEEYNEWELDIFYKSYSPSHNPDEYRDEYSDEEYHNDEYYSGEN